VRRSAIGCLHARPQRLSRRTKVGQPRCPGSRCQRGYRNPDAAIGRRERGGQRCAVGFGSSITAARIRDGPSGCRHTSRHPACAHASSPCRVCWGKGSRGCNQMDSRSVGRERAIAPGGSHRVERREQVECVKSFGTVRARARAGPIVWLGSSEPLCTSVGQRNGERMLTRGVGECTSDLRRACVCRYRVEADGTLDYPGGLGRCAVNRALGTASHPSMAIAHRD